MKLKPNIQKKALMKNWKKGQRINLNVTTTEKKKLNVKGRQTSCTVIDLKPLTYGVRRYQLEL